MTIFIGDDKRDDFLEPPRLHDGCFLTARLIHVGFSITASAQFLGGNQLQKGPNRKSRAKARTNGTLVVPIFQGPLRVFSPPRMPAAHGVRTPADGIVTQNHSRWD